MSLKIGAYITSYNSEETLLRCIKSILNQSREISSILIVDNSRIPIKDLELINPKIIVKHYSENIGISGGQKIAFAWAMQDELDFLWLFDQDSVPEFNCLESLLNSYSSLEEQGYDVGIVAPVARDPRSKLVIDAAMFTGTHFIAHPNSHNLDLPYLCDAPITSGSLIGIKGIKNSYISLSDLFIDGVDWELGMHLKSIGFNNFIIPIALLNHEFGTPSRVRKGNIDVYVQLYSKLRHYYICRNHTYLELKYSKGFSKLRCLIFRLQYLMGAIRTILSFDPNEKITKTWACLIGTWHGILGRLGKVY